MTRPAPIPAFWPLRCRPEEYSHRLLGYHRRCLARGLENVLDLFVDDVSMDLRRGEPRVPERPLDYVSVLGLAE